MSVFWEKERVSERESESAPGSQPLSDYSDIKVKSNRLDLT